ncbi:MAG: FUSC family protein [Sarcina sp.]
MLKKGNIIKAVIVFLIVFIFMFLAGELLGENNGIMGILIVLSTLMLLGKDLTGNPYRNMVRLSVFGIISVILSYVANLNPFLGLVINLIWIFVIVYTNVFNLKLPMYMSFLLTYLLLLVEKTTPEEIIPRSIALIFGAVFVVIIQMIMRKKKLKSNKNPNFKRCLKILDDELEGIINQKDIEKLKKDFNESIKIWNNNLLERKQNNFYFTASENRQSIIMANLEKMQKNILHINKTYESDKSYEIVFVSLRLILNEVKKITKTSSNSDKIREKLIQYGERTKSKSNDYNVYSLGETIKILVKIMETKNFETEDTKIIKKKPNLIKLLKYSMDKESLRFTFAVRMSILMALSYFVTAYMHLEYGKWIVFTLMSVCLPYDSTTEKAGRDRLKGTVLGAIVIFVTFAIFQNAAIRSGILALGFYMFMNGQNSIVKGMGTTMFSLSIAEMGVKAGTHAMLITGDRVMYTAIGFIVAMLGSKFILNYNINKETKNLINKYYDIINANVKNILSDLDVKEKATAVRASMLLTKSIENKIIINNSIIKNSNIEEFVEHSRNVMINIYEAIGTIITAADAEEIKEIRLKIQSNYKKFGTRFESMILENIEKDFNYKDKSPLYISFAETVTELVITKSIKDEIIL